MKWSSRSLGSSFQHGIFRMMVRLGLISAARLLLLPVSAWYALRPSIRRRYSYYLAHRFGRLGGMRAFAATARAYLNFAHVILDRMILATTGSLPLEQNPATLATIRRVLSEGRGCLLVSAHFGSWQVGLAGLEELGRPMNLVQWQDSGDVDRHYFTIGDSHRIRIINPRTGLPAVVEICAALKRNEIVCMMGDRFADYEREHVEAPFLGGTIRIPAAPWAIASSSGAPIVHTFSIRQNGRIIGLDPLEVRVPHGIRRRPDELRRLVTLFTERLEALTERYPLHFFNFYDMWSESNDQK